MSVMNKTIIVFVNGKELSLDEGTTLTKFLRSFSIMPDERGVAVALDGEVVGKKAWETTFLVSGQKVEIVHAVQGG